MSKRDSKYDVLTETEHQAELAEQKKIKMGDQKFQDAMLKAIDAGNETTKRQKLWNALHAFIHSNGGAVVSVPGAKVLRIEVSKDSPLPTKLKEIGYDPRHCGVTTRVTSSAFVVTDVIEIALPGK